MYINAYAHAGIYVDNTSSLKGYIENEFTQTFTANGQIPILPSLIDQCCWGCGPSSPQQTSSLGTQTPHSWSSAPSQSPLLELFISQNS